jgi:S1-C subfamily serine protease
MEYFWFTFVRPGPAYEGDRCKRMIVQSLYYLQVSGKQLWYLTPVQNGTIMCKSNVALEELMKILLYIVTAVLVVTAAGSGYFISNLNGQIDNLKTRIADNTAGLETKISTASADLNEAIQTTNKDLTDSIQKVDSTLTSTITGFTQKVETRLNTVQYDLDAYSRDISGLKTRAGAVENILDSSVLQSTAQYEVAKHATVRITDGDFLIGSGFIMAGNPGTETEMMGKVVTAYHVIKDLAKIYVTLYDGRSWEMQVWASAEATDIAILKFIAPKAADFPDMLTLPALKLADSLQVQTGDPVFVIGSPGTDSDYLGLTDTLTTGVISQTRRGEMIGDKYVTNLLQIDAAVNFGNSGGPLFNRKGEVIGIVIARLDPTLGDGISFAVTSNMIKKVDNIISFSSLEEFKYDYPWLGVGTNDLGPAYIVENKNKITQGAEVMSVTGPAATAGVMVGDIITAIDGQPLRDSGELSSWVAEYGASGKVITLTLTRSGVEKTITATLGIKP